MGKKKVLEPKVEVIENRPETDITSETERFFSSPKTPHAPLTIESNDKTATGKEVALRVPMRLLTAEKRYKTVEQLRKVIEKYFNDCDLEGRFYTVEGLSIHCGFSSTQTLANYGGGREGYEQFNELVKSAKLKILSQRVELAMKGKINPVLFIFLAANNNPADYKRDPDGKLAGAGKIDSFIFEYDKPKVDGDENTDKDKAEADRKAG